MNLHYRTGNGKDKKFGKAEEAKYKKERPKEKPKPQWDTSKGPR